MSKIFISYNRQSEAIARNLADDIEALGHTVWFDQDLSGGQIWWDRILSTIRDCDVFVFVLDSEAINSTACKREYGYAADLGKSILPVLAAEGMSTNLLSPALSQIQFVDYRKQDRAAVLRLARALTTVPPSQPLPDPLPAPPEVPLSYLGSLTEQIGTTSTLSYAEQSALIVDLKRSLRDPETKDDARTLLESLRKRRDLFATIAEEIDELLRSTGKASSDAPIAAEPEPLAQGPSEAKKQLPEAQSSRHSATQHASTLVSDKLPLQTKLATASCGGAVGTLCVAMAVFISGGPSARKAWLLISLIFGFVPWAIAGAITGNNRRVIAITFLVVAVGFVAGCAIAAGQGEAEALLWGMAFGACPGVILGATVGVILKRKGWLSSSPSETGKRG